MFWNLYCYCPVYSVWSNRCRSRQNCSGKGFLPELPQTCPKIFGATFCTNIFSWRSYFGWMTSKKTSSCEFGRHFLKSKHVGHHFCSHFQGFCPDFQGVCEVFTDFAQVFRNFARIFTKSKLLGVHLHSCLLHHCLIFFPMYTLSSSWFVASLLLHQINLVSLYMKTHLRSCILAFVSWHVEAQSVLNIMWAYQH